MRERAQMYLDDPVLVKNIIADGCEKARELARVHGIILLDQTELTGEPRVAAAPAERASAQPATKPPTSRIPVLRPDQEVKTRRRGFDATVPMTSAERRRMRVQLRPDHSVKVPRDFEATVPLTDDA